MFELAASDPIIKTYLVICSTRMRRVRGPAHWGLSGKMRTCLIFCALRTANSIRDCSSERASIGAFRKWRGAMPLRAPKW